MAAKRKTGNRPGRPAAFQASRRVSVLFDLAVYEQLRLHSFHLGGSATVSDVIRSAMAEWLKRHPAKPI